MKDLITTFFGLMIIASTIIIWGGAVYALISFIDFLMRG